SCERDDVPQVNRRSGLHAIGLVLLQACVPQGNLLLIIEPILVVRPQAGVQYPLLESQTASLRVARILLPLVIQRVPHQMRLCRDNVAPPAHQLLRLAGQDVAGNTQPALVLRRESGALLQGLELVERNWRPGGGRRTVVIARNFLGTPSLSALQSANGS